MRTSQLASTVSISVAFVLAAPIAAQAEGSKDLTSNGGQRPYLEYRSISAGLVPRKTIIKAYARTGETIELGSSAVGIGNGVINYRKPDGSHGSCNNTGRIANRSEEISGSFNPCIVTVGNGETGIWEIDFVSPDQDVPINSSNPPVISASGNWTQADGIGYVAAWDVTVKDNLGSPIDGRVYANYYAFNMGANNIALNSEFTVLTEEGYQYRLDLNGLDPFGFILFANNNGFKDANNRPTFRSLQYTGPNPGVLPSDYSFQNPNAPDSFTDITHKLFINNPAPDLPSAASSSTGTTWLLRPPVVPPTPQNFSFVGSEGTSGQAGTSPLGGIFRFDSPAESSYSITLDLNQNGIFGDANDRTFLGRAILGSNSLFWDGLDGNGNPLAASNSSYGASINLYAGEAHFPMVDAENNPNGIIIQRLNGPSGSVAGATDPFTVYYDDRNTGNSATDYSLCAGGETGLDCYGTASSPRQALTGISSQAGAHEFSSAFGNRRGINTWVYYPSTTVVLSGGIAIRETDLIITKTDNSTSVNAGNSLTYDITVTNAGPSDVVGATFKDDLSSKLTNISWTCAVTSGVGRCDQASGSSSNITTGLDLAKDAIATITITADVSPTATGDIVNTAKISRPHDVSETNPSNNSATDITSIIAAPLPLGSACYAVAGNGDQEDRLVQIQLSDGSESDVGLTGTNEIEAIAYWPITNTLYAADRSRLGILNPSDGTYSNLGSFGSGRGALGRLDFNNVDGLAFHPFTGELYGSVRREGGNDDLLIKIDPHSGSHVANAFGNGIDYLVIQTSTATNFDNIDDLTIDPVTGFLYGITNGEDNIHNVYVRIDPNIGSVSPIGPSLGTTDVEGLSTFNDGSTYITTGNNGPENNRNQFYRIDANGSSMPISSLSIGNDYESLACLTGAANHISGTIFLDPDTSASLTAGDSGTGDVTTRLYRDSNSDGAVDGGDILLSTSLSSSNGNYDFWVAATGSFVVDVNVSTLPLDNNILTTDNREEADFGNGLGLVDVDNNFGHYSNPQLVLVKRITAINNISLNGNVDDTYDNPSSSLNEASADNHPYWPTGSNGSGISDYLVGDVQRSGVRPGYEVEYSLYFLTAGNVPLTNVNLCDAVPVSTTYVPGSLELRVGSSTSTGLSDAADSDGGEFVPIGTLPAVPCSASTNSNGAVVVNLAQSPNQLPNATGPGTPANSYGYIRFRVTVD